MRQRLGAVLAALCLVAAPVHAANWATKEACAVTELTLPDGWVAPDDLQEIEARAAQIPNPTGKLWRITAPGGAVSHLYGTFHLNEPVILKLPPELKDILARTRIIATEIDPRPATRRQINNDPLESYRWRSSRGSSQEPPFEPEVLPWVRSYFSALGFERPWRVLTDAGVAEALLWDPCNDFHAGIFPILDDRIALEGIIAGAEHRALEETGTFLVEMNRSANRDVLYGMLQVFATYLEPASSNVARQADMALYAQGRIGAMMAWEEQRLTAIFGPERAATYLRDADGYLLRDRNRAWLERIESELKQGGVTMAVGAFHLPGEDGLIEMLCARGFALERIVAQGEVLR
ncbi:MAG: TraB/GumN family protein [Pseudomonadota bacterium]